MSISRVGYASGMQTSDFASQLVIAQNFAFGHDFPTGVASITLVSQLYSVSILFSGRQSGPSGPKPALEYRCPWRARSHKSASR